MSNNIVTVNVSQQVGSAPSNLQKTGAFVSQGGTTLAAGHYALITQVSDLTSILTPSNAITAIAWSANVVSVTLTNPHGVPSSDIFQGVISGMVPIGYNGTFQCTSTGTNTFTYPLGTNPGTETTFGSYTIGAVAQLTAMATTFFAQGSGLACYVLELGNGGTPQGVIALTSYINAPLATSGFSGQFYAYLLPTTWDAEPTAYTMATSFNGTTAQVYFYVTTTVSTYSNWLNIKSVLAFVQSPSAPITELSCAAAFWVALNMSPSASNMVSPFEYTFVYGVTPYTLSQSTQTTLKANNVNWVGTGAQGQISNTLIQTGNFMDGHPFNYWYAVDYMAINEAIALAAAVINGSNTPQNPLYYNQPGINALQKVAQSVANNAISFGLILAPATVTATSFTTYIAQNPSDYAAGIYRGLALTFVPVRGFNAITVYLTASNIPV